MTAGEGGAVVSRRPEIVERVTSLVNCGRHPGCWYYRHFELAGNLRLSEWQGAVLRIQLQRFPAQQEIRSANVDFLTATLADISGVVPLGRHKGCTSQGNYDYMVNFDPELFPHRDRLRTALLAEGMPLTTAYPPMHQLEMFSREGGLAPHIRDTSAYPAYASLHMPVTEHLSKTAIWFKTEVLTGSRQDAQSVVDAIEKVHHHAAEIGELEPTEW